MVWATALMLAAASGFTVYGPTPMPSCAEWVSMRGTTAGIQMDDWFLGVVTGYNMFAPSSGGDGARGASAETLLAWKNEYCRRNPLDNPAQVSRALVSELNRHAK
jgi:hypothetical protein